MKMLPTAKRLAGSFYYIYSSNPLLGGSTLSHEVGLIDLELVTRAVRQMADSPKASLSG